MIDKKELRRLAEAFPADLDWDSNTEPFFNGPSGESLGGGADGTYAVYGKPFRLEGEDYDYDGPTYVERCGKDFARFIVHARGGVLALLEELEACKADAARYRWLREKEAERGVSVVSIGKWLSGATCTAVTFVDGSFVDYAIDKAMGIRDE